MDTFPFIEVTSHETALPVQVIVWHIRSVRPIREASLDDETLTRLEFVNGDSLDVSESVPCVRGAIEDVLSPLAELAMRALRKLE